MHSSAPRVRRYFTARKDTEALAPTALIEAIAPTPILPPTSVIEPVLVIGDARLFVDVWVMFWSVAVGGGITTVSAMLATATEVAAPVALIVAELAMPLNVPVETIDALFVMAPVLIAVC